KEDREKARSWAKEFDLDAIFSTDGDGDRPLIADEAGEWLRGDILGLLCSLALDAEAVAIPVSCNSIISSGRFFKHVKLTKIGSPYVIEAFNELSRSYSRIVGFEANGGFLL
ncbi:phosphomannomutase, partial [Salmonella enterica subsp. enterica]|nr:phosphomannomutase [Salmonella enterica subsp. enterica]